MIPQTFDEWKNCLVNDCKLGLTSEFAEQRLGIFTNPEHPETKKFAALYGQQHLLNIITWFKSITNDQ